MTKRIGFLSIAVLLVFASVGFAQDYTMNLYGTYNGQSAVIGGEDVYVSPYTATIYSGSTQVFNGSIICDDFATNIPLPYTWTATATNAADVNASDKFYDGGNGPLAGYTAQEDYDAAAYLANELIANLSTISYDEQADISAAIWDIFDPSLESTGVDGNAITTYLNPALTAAVGGYEGSNVTVFTASPPTGSQEFLVVNGPQVPTPEPAAAAILGFDLLSVLGIAFLFRRYRVRV